LKPELRDQIICVLPTDECEKTTVKGEVFLTSEKTHKYSFSPALGIFAILASNPVQFIFDMLCIYLQKYKINKDLAKQSCYLLSYQLFIVFLFTYFLFQTIYYMMLTITQGQICLVFVTFLFAFIVD
jgi:ethanolamine transporter EutH